MFSLLLLVFRVVFCCILLFLLYFFTSLAFIQAQSELSELKFQLNENLKTLETRQQLTVKKGTKRAKAESVFQCTKICHRDNQI